MIGTILTILGPLLIRLVAWVLDYAQAKDATKKQFFLFVEAWESEKGVSVRLQDSFRAQVDEIRLAREKEENLKAALSKGP